MVRKICDEVECWQFSTDALDCQRPKRPSWRYTVFWKWGSIYGIGYEEIWKKTYVEQSVCIVLVPIQPMQ